MTPQHNLRRRDLVITLFVAVAIYLAWVIRDTLLLIYVSLIFAIVFTPAVDWVQQRRVGKWHPGRGAAILILLVAVLAAITLFAFFAIPPIVHDSRQLASQFPATVARLRDRLDSLPFGAKLAEHVNTQSVSNALQSLASQGFRVFRGLEGGLTALILIALVTAYFILDGHRAFAWAMSLAPVEERDRLTITLLRASRRAQRWLVGQLLLMAILGSLTGIFLGLMHVRYFYAVAVFAGIANFVPVLGATVTVILAGALAALDSWTKLLGVVLFYAAYLQVENAYLTPRIMRSTVDLPGVAIIIALALGGALGGILGAVVAVPTAALVGTIINEYLECREESEAVSPLK